MRLRLASTETGSLDKETAVHLHLGAADVTGRAVLLTSTGNKALMRQLLGASPTHADERPPGGAATLIAIACDDQRAEPSAGTGYHGAGALQTGEPTEGRASAGLVLCGPPENFYDSEDECQFVKPYEL